MYVESAAAGYNLLQLCEGLILARFEGNLKGAYICISWIGFLLDQVISSNISLRNHCFRATWKVKFFQTSIIYVSLPMSCEIGVFNQHLEKQLL